MGVLLSALYILVHLSVYLYLPAPPNKLYASWKEYHVLLIFDSKHLNGALYIVGT